MAMKKNVFYLVLFLLILLSGCFTFYIYYQETYVKLDKSLISISVDNEYWTSKDVTVTVEYKNKDIKIKSYSFDGGETWQSENSYTATENELLEIVLKTSNGKKSVVVPYRVENIDKEAPIINVPEVFYVAQGSEFTLENKYSVIDLISGIKGEVRVSPSVINTDALASYEVEIYAIDKALNSSNKKITVEILEPNDPRILEQDNPDIISVTGLTLATTRVSLVKGTTTTIQANIKPSNATNKNLVWTSSNEMVATVDQEGTITAKKAGSATITATTEDGNKSSDVKVVVTNEKIEVTKIELDSTSSTVTTDSGSITITATVSPENATDPKLTWNSSNPNVAIVVDGVVTIRGEGTATITATTSNGKYATYALTVTDKYTFQTKEVSVDTGEVMGYTIKIYKNGVDITKDVTTISSPFTARNEKSSDEISITVSNYLQIKNTITFNYKSKKYTAYK